MAKALSILIIVIGVTSAVFGKVRSGSLLLSVGTATIVYANYSLALLKRRIELWLPLSIALVLFAVALTLPHAG